MRNGIRVFGVSLAAFTAIVVGIVVITVGAIYLVGTLKKETADFRGGVDATESVHASGAYRIAAYDQFFNLCASIQAQEAQISVMTDELGSPLTPVDRQQILRASLTGLQGARNANIAQYNADASKADTRGNFLASNLPYQINRMVPQTTCAAG